jgi:DNA-binding MurR/RpiR family transcriptional regulator
MAASFAEWVEAKLAATGRSRVAPQVARAIVRQPERASYASSRDLAAMAGVDVSSITRAAQAMGFPGWPELRTELRSQYLRSLSTVELEAEHAAMSEGPAARSFEADRRALTFMNVDTETFKAVVTAISQAGSRVVVGAGTQGAAAQVLASHCTLAGYRMDALPDGVGLANGIARFGPGDLVIVIDFWRMYESTALAAALAHDLGATVCAITDAASPITEAADHVLRVPAEGGAFFPTLVAGISVINAIATELAEIDPAMTAASIAAAEKSWDAMGSVRSIS